jgi:hypothetical protein
MRHFEPKGFYRYATSSVVDPKLFFSDPASDPALS